MREWGSLRLNLYELLYISMAGKSCLSVTPSFRTFHLGKYLFKVHLTTFCSSPDYIAPNVGVISEWWITEDVEGSSCNLIWVNVPAFGLRDSGNPRNVSAKIVCLPTENRIRHLPSASQELSSKTETIESSPSYIKIWAYVSYIYCFIHPYYALCRSQWPRGLRHEMTSPAWTLGSWVRIPLETWMFVCVYSVFVLSCVGSSLATGWSLVQGVLPTVYKCKITEPHNRRPRPDMGGRAIE
jgi:hypothetical protein